MYIIAVNDLMYYKPSSAYLQKQFSNTTFKNYIPKYIKTFRLTHSCMYLHKCPKKSEIHRTRCVKNIKSEIIQISLNSMKKNNSPLIDFAPPALLCH